jgi:hypothetical protein
VSAPPTYCIDTSSILEARTRSYPPGVFIKLWEQIEALIEADRLVSPIEMLKELEKKDDETRTWAKKQTTRFVALIPGLVPGKWGVIHRHTWRGQGPRRTIVTPTLLFVAPHISARQHR